VGTAGGLWATELYEDDKGRSPYADWIDKLSDTKFVALDAAFGWFSRSAGSTSLAPNG
jgi:hypothetical protein